MSCKLTANFEKAEKIELIKLIKLTNSEKNGSTTHLEVNESNLRRSDPGVYKKKVKVYFSLPPNIILLPLRLFSVAVHGCFIPF